MVSAHTLHHSKNRWEKATDLQRLESTMHRRINELRKELTAVHIKNKIRQEQQNRDHNLIYLFKEMFKNEFEECMVELIKRYGKQPKLKILKRTLQK